jgi:hypothetical protein
MEASKDKNTRNGGAHGACQTPRFSLRRYSSRRWGHAVACSKQFNSRLAPSRAFGGTPRKSTCLRVKKNVFIFDNGHLEGCPIQICIPTISRVSEKRFGPDEGRWTGTIRHVSSPPLRRKTTSMLALASASASADTAVQCLGVQITQPNSKVMKTEISTNTNLYPYLQH